jgi:hypothetical protein
MVTETGAEVSREGRAPEAGSRSWEDRGEVRVGRGGIQTRQRGLDRRDIGKAKGVTFIES